MVANHLEKDSDFLKMRILSYETKRNMCNSFRKIFASRLAHVDGSLTKYHLATLLALVKDNDTSTEIQTISIRSATMCEAVLNWPEPPESYKETLRNLLQAEHVDLDKGVELLTKVFSFIPNLTKLRRIQISAYFINERIEDLSMQDLANRRLPYNITTFANQLGLTKNTPRSWQSDTNYTTVWGCADSFRRLEMTIVASLIALTKVRHLVEIQEIGVQADFRDILLEDLWYRWASIEEEYLMKIDSAQDDDPIYDNNTIPHLVRNSANLLAKLRGESMRISGSPDAAFELVDTLKMSEWTTSPFALAGISRVAKHFLHQAGALSTLEVQNTDREK